jgi:hypothetical protein
MSAVAGARQSRWFVPLLTWSGDAIRPGQLLAFG